MPKDKIISYFSPPDIKISVDMVHNLQQREKINMAKNKKLNISKEMTPVTLSPPMVICTNRRNLSLENYNCTVNENVTFCVDSKEKKPSEAKPEISQIDDDDWDADTTKPCDKEASNSKITKSIGGRGIFKSPVNLDKKKSPKSPIDKLTVSTTPKKFQSNTDDDWDDISPTNKKLEDHTQSFSSPKEKIEPRIEQAQCFTGAIPKDTSKIPPNQEPKNENNEIKDSTSKKPKSRKTLIENLQKYAKKKEQNKLISSHKSENGSCQCTKCDNFLNCTEWCTKNLEFNVPHINDARTTLPLFKTESGKAVTLETHFTSKILLHGMFIPKQIFSLEQTVIDKNVQQMLKSDNCSSAMHMQSYVWSEVQRGFNICMIAPQKNGKTLAYLPGFCSFCIEKNERYSQVQNFEGPLCAIVCPSVTRCLKIQKLAQKLLQPKIQDVNIEVLTEAVSHQGDCDLLIALPSVLETQLKSGAIKLKRLCHFAIEDASNLLKNYNQSMKKIFQVLAEIQKRRPCKKNVQIVISSEKWSLDLQLILKKLYLTPLVCFSDFLEASIYSNIQFKRKKLNSAHKCFYVIDQLRKKYMTQKTVIFCNKEEMPKLSENLNLSGIECIAISNSLTEDEFLENEDMWNTLRAGHYKVLLCTDALFEKTVHILGAQNLVHFSLPSDWVQFGKRFRCLSENLHSPLNSKENETPASFMIIDETSENQLFLEFFEGLSRNSVSHLELP